MKYSWALIPLISVAIIVVTNMNHKHETASYREQISKLTSEYELFKAESVTSYSTIVNERDNLILSNGELNRQVKKNREKVSGVHTGNVHFRDVNVEGIGASKQDTTSCQVNFTSDHGSTHIVGKTVCPEGLFNIQVTRDPVDITIYLTEDESGIRRDRISVSDSTVTFSDWNVSFKPYKDPSDWWLGLDVLASDSNVGAGVSAGRNNWGISSVFTTEDVGWMVGIRRTF